MDASLPEFFHSSDQIGYFNRESVPASRLWLRPIGHGLSTAADRIRRTEHEAEIAP